METGLFWMAWGLKDKLDRLRKSVLGINLTIFILAFFLWFPSIFGGNIGLVFAQDRNEGRSATMTSMDGEFITMWTEDSNACTEIRGRNSKCQDISDACVKKGGCYPMLVTLEMWGCKKCDAAAGSCYAAVAADEKKCVKAAVAKYALENAAPPQNREPPNDEAACHESCQSTNDTCTRECRSEEIFTTPDTDQGSSIDICFSNCEQTQSSCSTSCREAAQAIIANQQPEKPSVGVSSKDFKALAQMHNQLQYAQAQLDQIKASGDPRWIAKQDSQSVGDDAGESLLDKIKEELGRTKDAASVALDAKELYDFLTQGKFGSYSSASFTADVGNGVIAFTELVGKGVSIENATTKALIDSAAPSLFIIFPPLKVADMVTTMPATIMNALGVFENDPLHQAATFIKESAAPSSFIGNTTTAMVTTENWTNMGTILQGTFEDFQSAEGLGEKLVEGLNIIGVAIGAIPVVVALQVNDVVSVNIFIGESVVNFVSGMFTYYPY